jgi:hypothetical protein
MNKRSRGYRWKPLRRAQLHEPDRTYIAAVMRQNNCDAERARQIADEECHGCEYWCNDLYQVEVRRFRDGLVHLNVRRIDGAAVFKDWRHFQQIKNELIGPECEAIELYPAESRKVDTSNKYHLYGYADPTFRFPVGFEKRNVDYQDVPEVPGMRQRGQTTDFCQPATLRAP